MSSASWTRRRLLSDFADSAIEQAIEAALTERVPGAEVQGITVIALGKLGSRELNYSSDVDLLVLFDPAAMPRRERDDPSEAAVRIGRRMIELLQKRTADGYVVRVDLRLRPSPEVTPIVLPINAAISHYESSALPWERAAFIRARVSAGDRALGKHFLQSIQPFVWRRSLDFGVIEEVREISARIRDHFAQGARLGPGYDLKRGRGGIREVEFFAQIQQMIHGGRDPSVRASATLDALEALRATGQIADEDASALSDAYILLRTIEHRVQMVDDAQTHLLPIDREALDGVAKLHGLAASDELIGILKPHVERAESLFNSLAPDREGRLSNDPDILVEELKQIGFADPDVPLRRITDWRSGKARSLRSPGARTAFEAMLPPLLREIASGPDPDRALNRLADIVERLSSGINLYRLLEARPQLARHVALILAYAAPLADMLARRPDLLDGLIDESSFALPPEPAAMAERLRAAMSGEPYDHALDRARRVIAERRFSLGVQLIAAHADPLDLAMGYSDLAEGTIVALAELASDEFARTHGRIEGGELMILALGAARRTGADPRIRPRHHLCVRCTGGRHVGRREAAQRDGLFQSPCQPRHGGDQRADGRGATLRRRHAPSAAGRRRHARRHARRLPELPAQRGVDLGAYGALPSAADLRLPQGPRSALQEGISSILSAPRDASKTRADAAKMRDDMARHKAPAGPFDIKLGPGGLVDLEFAVHTIQLVHGKGLDPRLEYAIEGLAQQGLIDSAYDADLRLLSRILVVMRLVAPDSNEPPEKSRGLVASLCGHESWESLLAAHDEARQRIAALWKSVREAK